LQKSLLRHSSLVGLISAGVHEQCAYIITELYAQGNLYNYLRQDSNPLPHEQAIGFLLDISSGMNYLHSVGIVHRDLKSLNVLMDGTHCRITDYGTSRFIHQSTQMTGNVGTGPWMAPEGTLFSHAKTNVFFVNGF
jgi:serine/threonine protein kinase